MSEPSLRAAALWDAFNARDLDVLQELIAEEFVNDAALPGTPSGPAGMAAVWQRLWRALPDARFTTEVVMREGDTVISIGTMEGTHQGELMGIQPSGRRVRWQQCHVVRVDADGRVLHHRGIRDDLAFLRQTGAAFGT